MLIITTTTTTTIIIIIIIIILMMWKHSVTILACYSDSDQDYFYLRMRQVRSRVNGWRMSGGGM